MSEWVKAEDLEDVCRIYGISYGCIMDNLRPVSKEDITNSMPISELRELLEKRDRVFATQIWTKDDIVAGLKAEGITDIEDILVAKIIKDVKSKLEDYSDGWDILMDSIKKILEQEGLK